MVESNNKMEDLFREMLHLHPVDKDGYRIQKDILLSGKTPKSIKSLPEVP